MASDTKESLMIVAGGNITEYKELRRLSVEDFIIRYNGYITEIELQKEVTDVTKKKR